MIKMAPAIEEATVREQAAKGEKAGLQDRHGRYGRGGQGDRGEKMSEASAATGRVVLFGATGYTGDLTARAMAKRGMRPVLAARRQDAVEALAAELGGLESAVADVADPSSIRALLERGDTLVTTVGPFARWGDAALDAAIDAGAHYIDSTGEPPSCAGSSRRPARAQRRAGPSP